MLTSAPFSSRLRDATVGDHSRAETSAFMTAVMNGEADRDDYAALLVQLREIYSALDTAAVRHDGEWRAFFDPRLARGRALDADLAFLGDRGHEVTPTTQVYAQRVAEVSEDPLLVLAHHYTRYLGDLSGGRAIAARLQQNLGLTPDAGLAFYQFDIGPAPAYKHAYRDRLDSLDLSFADEDRFIAEVTRAYGMNSAVFASLDHLL